MKTISAKVISSKPLSLSKATKFLDRFVSSEATGAPESVSRFLRRSSGSFNELVKFHRELKSGKSGRKHGESQLEALKNENLMVIEEKAKSFDFGEERSVGRVENGGGDCSDGEGSGKKKKKDKKKSEIKVKDVEREVGKPEKVKSLGFGDEQSLRYVENGRGASEIEGSGNKKKNTKKNEIKVDNEEREVGKSEEVEKGRSHDFGEKKSLRYLENGRGGSNEEGSGKKKKNSKKSEIKGEDEEREVGKPEKVKSLGFGVEQSSRYLENGRGVSDGEGSEKKKKNKKKSEINSKDEEREVGKPEEVGKGRSFDLEEEKNLRYLQKGMVRSDGEGSEKKTNKKKSETKAEEEEREVGKPEKVGKGRSFDLEEENNLRYLENGRVRSDGEGSGQKRTNKKKSESKAEDEEREVGKPEKVDERKKRKKVEDDERRSLDGSEERHSRNKKKRRHGEDH